MKRVIGLILCIMLVASFLAACDKTPEAPVSLPASDAPPLADAPPVSNAPVPDAPPAAPAAGGGPIKVGIVNNPPAESGYRAANVADMERVFSAANGYDASMQYSILNDEQLNFARGFISDGVDYLLISAAETVGWDAVLKDANEAGIKVFLFDRMLDVSIDLYEAAVVSDMANQGKLAMEWLLAQNLPRYDVIHIQGAMSSDAQIGRTGAFEAEVAAGRMKKVFQQSATWDENVAKEIVESVIASQGRDSFNIIYAENDGMAAGAVAALQDAGISHGVGGDVIIIGVDANKWALREVLEGNWNLDVQCSPFQADVIHGFIQQLEGGGSISVPADKKVISEERYFDAATITEAEIAQYGLGD